MFKVVVDTCVWIDLARNIKGDAILDALETFIDEGSIELLVPAVVIAEFSRNRERIVKEGLQSLVGAVQRVRGAVNQYGDPRNRARLANNLTDLEHRLPNVRDTIASSVSRIERILKKSRLLELSDSTKTRAAERALAGKAPFHRNKNAIGDALILEMYVDALASLPKKGMRFAFVTHNKNDFSMPNGDHRKPHPDLAQYFSKIRSLYCVSLTDVLVRVDANEVAEHAALYELLDEPRSASTIFEAMEKLADQVWYNRHQVLRERIEAGELRVVDVEPKAVDPVRRETIQRRIWLGAQKSARRLEKKWGLENLGPWDDFEWGMINGKLSALRWVLGGDWDDLDT